MLLPTYVDEKSVFLSDTCDPLRDAAKAGAIGFAALAREHYPGEPMPEGELPGVMSLGFWDAPRTQTWGLAPHRNEGIEITCLARGRTGFAADSNIHSLSKGSLTVTRPWQQHQVGLPNVEASRLHWIIVDVNVRRPNQRWEWPEWIILSSEEIRRLTELLQYNETPVWHADEGIIHTFEAIAELVQRPTARSRYSTLALLVNQLLLKLLDLLEENRIEIDTTLTSSRRCVSLFLETLKEHVDEYWTLDRMAESCGLARTQFAELCKDLTNLSPIQYLSACRIEKAKSILVARPGCVTDVAMSCGFNSSQYFANVFRAHTGLSPQAFARERTARR